MAPHAGLPPGSFDRLGKLAQESQREPCGDRPIHLPKSVGQLFGMALFVAASFGILRPERAFGVCYSPTRHPKTG
jgi:hypothetical protein